MDRRVALLLLAGLFPALGQATGGRTTAIRWQPPLTLARGAGERGPWRQNDSRYDFVDDATVALAPNGTAAVAWVDQARKAVLFQRVSPQGRLQLDRPVDVSRQPATFSWLPRLALAPDAPQRVFVLWQEIIFSGGSHGGEMMLARSLDGGHSFAPPVNLSGSRGGDGKGRLTPGIWHNGSYDLLAAPDGQVLAAWTEYEGSLWVSRSADGGANFSAPQRLAGGESEGGRAARAPALALAPDGTVFLAWSDGDHPQADIRLAVAPSVTAQLGSVRTAVGGPGHDDAPRLALDRGGVLHLAYAERPGGPFGAPEVRYRRSFDGGRSFESPRVLSRPLPRRIEGAGYPQLGLDARGHVLVAWELFDDAAGARPRGLGLALSGDGGQGFGPPARVPGSEDPGGGLNGSSQGLLARKLSLNAAGDLALVNSALRPGSHSRVWLMRARLA